MAFNGSTLTFDTITDLRAQRGAVGSKVNVLGYSVIGDDGKGSFYWDDSSTESDNSGTIIQVTGVVNGRWKRLIEDGTYSVKWFGAKGDYNLTTGADDTTAINNCISYLTSIKTTNFKPTLLFPESEGYLVTSTITVPNGIHVIMKADMVYNGLATAGALVIGTININNSRVNFEIRLRQRSIPVWTDTNITDNNFGVKFINLLNTTSGYIPSVSFFCNNIIFEGNGTTAGAFAYNTIIIGSSTDAINHLTIQNAGTVGWVNENSIISGNFQNSSSTASRATDRHGVLIKTSSPFIPNNNHFYKPCFQLGHSSIPDPNINNSIPVWIQSGNSNFFHDIRSENSGNTMMQTDNSSNGNYIYTGVIGITDETELLIENSDARNNFVEDDQKKRISIGSAVIFDSGFLPEKVNKYDATRWYIPGVSWTRIADATVYPTGAGLTINSSYIQVGSSERFGVYIDTTVAKKFALKYDIVNEQGGRITLRVYDGAGAVITPTSSPSLVSPPGVFSTIVTSYGGAYTRGTDSPIGYAFFAVDETVKKVFIALSGGTQPLLIKSFQISSLDGVIAAVTSGLDRKFGNFGMAQIIPTEAKPLGTIIYNDLTSTSTPFAWQNTDGGTTWTTVNSATSAASQTANTVYAGPTSGGAATPAFRTLVSADIPDISTTYIKNQVATPQTGTGFNTAGTGLIGGGTLTLNNATSNYILWNNVGVGAPAFTTRSAGTRCSFYAGAISGTTTEYAIGIEGSHVWFSVPNNLTSNGFKFYGATTLVARIDATGRMALGTSAVPTATLDVIGDGKVSTNFTVGGQIQILGGTPGAGKVLTDVGGTGLATWVTPSTSGGTVTSVDLTVPSVFSVSGNPITTSGTLAVTFASGQTQNQVLASPNGSSGAVSLRALVAADLPTAAADGATKGIAAFATNDFDAASGVISIDYTNGQKATSSVPGFMSTANQSFAGIKTFTGDVLVPGCAVSGKLGVGTGTTVPTSANIFSVNTTLPQIKGGYDTSNYWTIQASSTGSTTFALAGTSPEFTFSQKVNINADFNFTGKLSMSATNTAGGTTGNQTINKPTGTVNIAAAGTTVTVTNNLVTTSSIIFSVIRTDDATATIKNVVPAAGSFTINLNAATTAEVSIGFLVVN